MKATQRIAVFMMVLILSLPIVLAQELSIQKFQGQDNAKGYARVQDKVTIEVLVKIPGEEIIDKEQVRIYIEDSYTFFDSCAPDGTTGYHKCIFYEPEFEAYEPITFTIELRDDDGNIVGSETKTLVLDNQLPIIKEFNVDPPISNGDITISYAAEDYALNFGDTTSCSGFKTITIKAGSTVVANDTGVPGECNKDNVIETTLTTSGKQQVCAVATDQLNYVSAPKCKEVTVDKASPDIKELSILDPQGFIITHVHTGEERTAQVNVVITDDGEVDGSNVFANFQQLNPNLPDFIPPDLADSDIYSWQNIPVSEVSPCKVSITAKDMLGNEAVKDFDCTIKADDTPPTVTGIIPEATRNNTPLYGYGTNIIIEFEDADNTGGAGIGFRSKKAYLDLSEMSMGSSVQADTCSHLSGSTWRCAWLLNPPAGIDETTYTIALSESTSDDLDNTIGQPQNYEIVYDEKGPRPPKILEFKVVSGEAGVTYEGGAVRGDFVQYKVQSANFETALANFTWIGGQPETTPTSCEDADNMTNCIFESLVDISGPYTAQLSFNFYDDAKNNASVNTTLQVYGLDNETNAKYWKSPPVVTCSPRLIDRSTAALIPPYVACRVDLTTPRNDITTLAIAGPTSPDDCGGDVELNLNDIYVVNNGEGSKSPYLFMRLEPKNYYVNELNLSCPLQVYSKRAVTAGGQTQYFVSRTPQEIPVNFTLQFYNNPLGDLTQNIDDKIDRAMDKGLASQEWISQLRKFLYYGELICYMKTLLTNIIGALTTVTIVLGITADALKTNPFTAAAGVAVEATKVTTCTSEETLAEAYVGSLPFLDSICSVINCAAVGGKGAGIEAYAGGGVPWCSDVKALLNGLDFTAGAGKESQLSGVTVKDSLILSVLCLCLPGIIYNLDKLRQIDCFEAVCLNDYVKKDGYPTDFCESMHDYFVCAFVIGEIFSLLPFARFFDALMDMLVTFITDPVALFTTALGWVCTETCYSAGSTMFAVCSLTKTVSVIAEAVAAVKKMSDTKNIFEPVGNEYCERMEEIKDEREEESA